LMDLEVLRRPQPPLNMKRWFLDCSLDSAWMVGQILSIFDMWKFIHHWLVPVNILGANVGALHRDHILNRYSLKKWG
jgi:hypothetical protein